jgi:hypothetical protein
MTSALTGRHGVRPLSGPVTPFGPYTGMPHGSRGQGRGVADRAGRNRRNAPGGELAGQVSASGFAQLRIFDIIETGSRVGGEVHGHGT